MRGFGCLEQTFALWRQCWPFLHMGTIVWMDRKHLVLFCLKAEYHFTSCPLSFEYSFTNTSPIFQFVILKWWLFFQAQNGLEKNSSDIEITDWINNVFHYYTQFGEAITVLWRQQHTLRIGSSDTTVQCFHDAEVQDWIGISSFHTREFISFVLSYFFIVHSCKNKRHENIYWNIICFSVPIFMFHSKLLESWKSRAYSKVLFWRNWRFPPSQYIAITHNFFRKPCFKKN